MNAPGRCMSKNRYFMQRLIAHDLKFVASRYEIVSRLFINDLLIDGDREKVVSVAQVEGIESEAKI